MRARGIFLYGACATIGFFTWHRTQSLIKRQPYSELIFDDLLSEESKKVIREFIEKDQNSTSNSDSWCNELKNNFKYIGNITIKQQGIDYQEVIIDSARPIAIFNDNFLVVETGFILPRLTFLDQATKNLPTIYSDFNAFNKNKFVDKSVLNLIKEIPSSCATKFVLLFIDETNLILYERKKPELLFKITEAQMAQIIKLVNLKQSKEIIDQQKKYLKSSKSIVVDFRFDNQIVVYPLNDTDLQRRLELLQKR